MNNHFRRQLANYKLFLSLFSALILITGFVFAMSARPALASNAEQAATTTPTATVAQTETAVGTPTVAGTATATSVPIATLPAAIVTGTPTALVPVTGADLTPPGGQSGIILRIATGLLGLFLIALGFRSYRLSKR